MSSNSMNRSNSIVGGPNNDMYDSISHSDIGLGPIPLVRRLEITSKAFAISSAKPTRTGRSIKAFGVIPENDSIS